MAGDIPPFWYPQTFPMPPNPGWLCVRCGKSNSPTRESCDCTPMPHTTPIANEPTFDWRVCFNDGSDA